MRSIFNFTIVLVWSYIMISCEINSVADLHAATESLLTFTYNTSGKTDNQVNSVILSANPDSVMYVCR